MIVADGNLIGSEADKQILDEMKFIRGKFYYLKPMVDRLEEYILKRNIDLGKAMRPGRSRRRKLLNELSVILVYSMRKAYDEGVCDHRKMCNQILIKGRVHGKNRIPVEVPDFEKFLTLFLQEDQDDPADN